MPQIATRVVANWRATLNAGYVVIPFRLDPSTLPNGVIDGFGGIHGKLLTRLAANR